MTEVVAALIWEGERFLVCRRPANKARGLCWEFVGGKVEAGESPQAALMRECREELDIAVVVDDLYMQLEYEYPDITVRLSLYGARIAEGEPKLLEHSELRWFTPQEAFELAEEFCPADAGILARLLREGRPPRAPMQRVPGRPTVWEGRLEKERRCYDLLDGLGVSYERVDHEKADNMEICTEIDRVLGAQICKNLFLCNRQQTDFYLLMIPADKIFKTKDLSRQIGSSRLSFAGAAQMLQFLDITPGSVSVLGLMNDTENRVRLLVDEELLQQEYIGCHPCINTSSLWIRREDLFGPVLRAMHHEMTVVQLLPPVEETE